MIGSTARRLVGPAVALALLVALTGCGKLASGQGATGGGAPVDSAGAGVSASASAATDDSSALDAISQDLDSAATANTEAGSNVAAGDQAATTGDEP